ncbi:ferrochelatase [Ameyamaea chiangmaiensis NBRC 103196]|uniref:Ferrochelatase n=1 Tax=Ameyamaea chiangmaiensis TaxID=442969 RepID=A0A850P9U7_9PROT|nr:ferrochelatase [Ameyamaea chiangmaiensis]MBS4074967.1 ferrochelatase [Ameyamaea chiangmaiensis]NVN39733.1 ferrochelatase [Ameyamaea chiangmaiensis]GBQ63368.1 ferrochelatase [Ameyamaea chiangmaiensis NBRC 103196]
MRYLFDPASAAQPYGHGKCGVLLVNLGTPDAASVESVRRYLGEFLSDTRVIETSKLIWQPILRGIVLRTRPAKSLEAYRRIWNEDRDESPLRTYTRAQAELLSARLAADGVPVAWAMRYGAPSLGDAIATLMRQGCERIVSIPLYPQYSATTTATANDQAFRALMRLRRQPAFRTAPSFPDDPLYIRALADSVRDHVATLPTRPDLIVASFHGLPVQYVKAGDPYDAECRRTMVALRAALSLDEAQLPLTFQSRFGPTKWLQPYTAPFVEALPKRGIRSVSVIMPGFLADCIETLDEIGNELRHAFVAAGGEQLSLVPCLNDQPALIDLLEALARRELGGWLGA